MKRLYPIAALVGLSLVVGACGRSSNETETGAGSDTTTTAAAPAAKAAGDFGDLRGICGPGDGSGSTAQGVSDNAIDVATSSDPGFAGRPGLDQELFDAAEVFVKWCNDAGGILGRKINLHEYDAKITDFKAQVVKACQTDFFLVGNGNVLDNAGQPERLKCLLPQIPAYVVSPEARNSELSVQPIPNRTDTLPVNDLRYLQQRFPDAVKSVATVTAKELASTSVVEQQMTEGAKQLGWNVVYRGNYNALGEPTWTPIAQSIKDNHARGLMYTGEPQNLALLENALTDIGYKLDFVVSSANLYDKLLIEGSKDKLQPTFVRVAITPFEQASKNPAMQQYLDLFAKYKPTGKAKAALAPQAFSAWLLFAKAAKECGSQLTRKCVYEHASDTGEWTAGGLHAAQNVKDQKPGACGVVVEATPTGFTTPDGFVPNEGVYQCEDGNVLALTGDYPAGTTLASVGKSLADLK